MSTLKMARAHSPIGTHEPPPKARLASSLGSRAPGLPLRAGVGDPAKDAC